MAFSFTNYAGLPPSYVNPLESALAGYQKGLGNQKQRLENEKAKALAPYLVQREQAEIKNQESQAPLHEAQAGEINYKLKHPGYFGDANSKLIQSMLDNGMITTDELKGLQNNDKQNEFNNAVGQAGQVGRSDQMASQTGQNGQGGQLGSNFKFKNPLANKIWQKQFADADYKQKATQGWEWLHATQDTKNYMIGQAAAAGIDPSEATRAYAKGLTFQDLLKQKGLDPNVDYGVDFLPTQGNRTQLNIRRAALAEMKPLTDFISEGLGPYAQTVFNYSPKQIVDSISGMNRDQRIKFLAARFLAPDLAAIRAQAVQGRVGVELIKHMEDQAHTNAQAFSALISPDEYMAAQQLATKQIERAVKATNKVWEPTSKNKSFVEKIEKGQEKLTGKKKDVKDMTTEELEAEYNG